MSKNVKEHITIDSELLAIGCDLSSCLMECGICKFHLYSIVMIAETSEYIRPLLKSIYEATRYAPQSQNCSWINKLSTPTEVCNFNIDIIDKDSKLLKTIACVIKDDLIKTQLLCEARDELEKIGIIQMSLFLCGLEIDRLVEPLGKIIVVATELGLSFILNGICQFDVWRKHMGVILYGLLRNSGLSYECIYELIDEIWGNRISYNGEIKQLNRWAAEMEDQEQKRKKVISYTTSKKLTVGQVQAMDLNDNIKQNAISYMKGRSSVANSIAYEIVVNAQNK